MTDKKQIIIDGVDVSGCEYLKYDKIGCYADDCYCLGNDCYYKQLARKTQECEEKDERIIELTKAGRELKQECEELKIKIEEWNAANVELAVELDRYRKALEEIEKIVQTITETNKVYPLQNNLFKILDIIKTAKGEE